MSKTKKFTNPFDKTDTYATKSERADVLGILSDYNDTVFLQRAEVFAEGLSLTLPGEDSRFLAFRIARILSFLSTRPPEEINEGHKRHYKDFAKDPIRMSPGYED